MSQSATEWRSFDFGGSDNQASSSVVTLSLPHLGQRNGVERGLASTISWQPSHKHGYQQSSSRLDIPPPTEPSAVNGCNASFARAVRYFTVTVSEAVAL
jgi:hypothetical protein